MDEAINRRWDVGLRIVAPMIAIAGILVGLWQFMTEESRRAELDFERRLWLQELEAYRTLAADIGAIVSALSDDEKIVDEDQFAAGTQRFRAAFWGYLLLLDQPDVEREIIEFHNELRDFSHGWSNSLLLKRQATSLLAVCRRASRESAPGVRRATP